MVPTGLERGLEELGIGGRIEIFQTTGLLRSDRILRRVLERILAVTQTPVKNYH